jgi:hypothetical protein
MPAGVRLHHPELRGPAGGTVTYTLIHEGRPLKAPTDCWACGETHYHKTYHLNIDSVGDVVVSKKIFRRLKEAGLDELKAMGEVKNPEPIVLDMGDQTKPLVVSREHGPRS